MTRCFSGTTSSVYRRCDFHRNPPEKFIVVAIIGMLIAILTPTALQVIQHIGRRGGVINARTYIFVFATVIVVTILGLITLGFVFFLLGKMTEAVGNIVKKARKSR
jgi:hypothetical protein